MWSISSYSAGDQLEAAAIGQVAAKHRVLQVVTEAAQALIHSGPAAVVGDVVGDDVTVPHVNASRKVGTRSAPPTAPGEQPDLDLEHAAIADPVAEHRMRYELVHPPLVGAEEGAPPRHTKSARLMAPVLIALNTTESTISGRNSSMRSSASASRP